MAFFTSIAVCANYLGNGWVGFSGVHYGLFAWIIVDYIFSLRKAKRSKTNIIFGAVILVAIYVAASCVDFDTFKFTWYPYDLLYNMGHYSSFLASTILALFVNICQLKVLKEYGKKTINKIEPINKNQSSLKLTDNSNELSEIKGAEKPISKKKLSKSNKIVYIIALALCSALSLTTIGCCVAASQRQVDSTVYIECNFEEYNAEYNFKFNEAFSCDSIAKNWKEEKGLDSNTVYELYFDKEYKNAIPANEQTWNLGYWGFVPLAYSGNYTVYIKITTIP